MTIVKAVVNGNSGKFIKSNAENPTKQTKRAAVRIKQKDPELLEWIESQTKSLTREIYLFSDGMVSTSLEVAKREKALIKLTNFEKEPSNPAFIPRSARLNIGITHSEGLKDDPTITGLIYSLDVDRENFIKKLSKTFKSVAKRELEYSREMRAETLVRHSLAIFELLCQVALKVDRIITTPPEDKSFKELGAHCLREYIDGLDKKFYKEFLRVETTTVDHMIEKQSGIKAATTNDTSAPVQAQGFTQATLPRLVEHLKTQADKFYIQCSSEIVSEEQESKRRKEALKEIEAEFKAEAVSNATNATAEALAAEPTASSATLDKLLDEKLDERTANVQRLSKKVDQQVLVLNKSSKLIKNFLSTRSPKEKATALQKGKVRAASNNNKMGKQQRQGNKRENPKHQNPNVRFSTTHSKQGNGNHGGDNNGSNRSGKRQKTGKHNSKKK
jgi:hypothetical protein